MKTPRDLLFARHQAATPKLDAIRRTVVEGLNNEAAKPQSLLSSFAPWCLGCSNRIWLELVWPCRRIWTGLAAVWILLVIINVSPRFGSHPAIDRVATTAAMMTSFHEEQKLLNELFADRSLPAEAARPRIFSPKPRTEILESKAA